MMKDISLQNQDADQKSAKEKEVMDFFGAYFVEFLNFTERYMYRCTQKQNCSKDIVNNVMMKIVNKLHIRFLEGNTTERKNYVLLAIRRDIKSMQDNCISCNPHKYGDMDDPTLDAKLIKHNPFDSAKESDDIFLLKEIKNKLADEEKKLFFLLLEDFNAREVAEHLEISLEAAQKRIYRLMQKMKKILNGG